MCSFERLHPALADAHHLRTKAENERLQQAAAQAAQRHSLCAQRTPRTRAGSSSSRVPPPQQLPDWDRVVSPDKLRLGSAGQAWRPVSPTGKRVAPPDSPSPRSKRQHVTKAMGDRATMAPADAAAGEERELQARVAAFERSLQVCFWPLQRKKPCMACPACWNLPDACVHLCRKSRVEAVLRPGRRMGRSSAFQNQKVLSCMRVEYQKHWIHIVMLPAITPQQTATGTGAGAIKRSRSSMSA